MTRRPETLRLRIFAGPNGSGKSTVIQSIKDKIIDNRHIDFGIYINADDIAKNLKKEYFSFSEFKLNELNRELFVKVSSLSGLINHTFTKDKFLASFTLEDHKIYLNDPSSLDRLAQIIADFLRERLLVERKKISFETVFSHESKLGYMKRAKAAGYKIYLYFVATESPEINVMRVANRVKTGGHHVPEDRIWKRYTGALNLLFDASQLAYQAYYFDNSRADQAASQFAHFKMEKGVKKWDDDIDEDMIPNWFKEFYSNKIPGNQ